MGRSQARQEFRIFHAEQQRLIYLACHQNDTSIAFNELGWEALDHFTGMWLTLAKEGDGSVLMQSTGKLDKFKRKIFEGDLVAITSGVFKSHDLYEVKWNDEHACFAFFQNNKFVTMLDKINLRLMNMNDIEIISNIYKTEINKTITQQNEKS